jgi:hypothetical protein
MFDTSNPVSFFTTVADQMVHNSSAQWCAEDFHNYTNTFGSEITSPFSVTNIPVLIGGQFVYTPAVNRLLQVAANVYEATTDSPYPTVFRPLFTATVGGDLFISGYTNVSAVSGPNDIVFSTPFDAITVAAAGGINVPVNVYGVPWIIGAKKGLPNFNEFAMENTLTITRRLQVTRPAINLPSSVDLANFHTNQMYLMSLSSSIGIELWNSYVSNYSGNIVVGINESAIMTITNDEQITPYLFQQTCSTNYVTSPLVSWTGSGVSWAYSTGIPMSGSIKTAIFAGPTLVNSVYRSPYATMPPGSALVAPGFEPTNYFSYYNPGTLNYFETNSPNGFHFPQFGVLVTNRLQVFMLDVTNGVYRVIDYVSFAGPEGGFNVNSSLADPDLGNTNMANYGVWNTNYPNGSSPPNGVTWGVLSQISASKSDTAPGEDGAWKSDPEAAMLGATKQQQADYFTAFFKPGNRFSMATNLMLSVVAPYSPTRSVVQYVSWQANDPLVHYLASDIDSIPPKINITSLPKLGVNAYNADQFLAPLSGLNLGFVNDRYMPWSGNHRYTDNQLSVIDTNRFNLAERDPLVTQSDNWNFPSGPFTAYNWIGRVHRGTPWQTVYLKSTDILTNDGVAVWKDWTGNGNTFDAANSAPVQDWHLASLLTALLNTNASVQLVSINNPDTNVWLDVLNGLTVWTNSNGKSDPLVISSSSPEAATIANAIQSTRLGQLRQTFGNVGDILATEQLTEQSPFLAGLNVATQISDETYEILPGQLLTLLRADSVGAVLQTNGGWNLHFTGSDGYAYALQASSDLVNWISIGTNYPVQGSFSVPIVPLTDSQNQFYRSVLLH